MSGHERSAVDEIPGYRKILDDLSKIMAEIQPSPVFASSVLFPADAAWRVKDARHEYLCAGPAFWDQMPAEVVESEDNPFLLGAVKIIDIDLPNQREMRSQVIRAVLAAMYPEDPA